MPNTVQFSPPDLHRLLLQGVVRPLLLQTNPLNQRETILQESPCLRLCYKELKNIIAMIFPAKGLEIQIQRKLLYGNVKINLQWILSTLA